MKDKLHRRAFDTLGLSADSNTLILESQRCAELQILAFLLYAFLAGCTVDTTLARSQARHRILSTQVPCSAHLQAQVLALAPLLGPPLDDPGICYRRYFARQGVAIVARLVSAELHEYVDVGFGAVNSQSRIDFGSNAAMDWSSRVARTSSSTDFARYGVASLDELGASDTGRVSQLFQRGWSKQLQLFDRTTQEAFAEVSAVYRDEPFNTSSTYLQPLRHRDIGDDLSTTAAVVYASGLRFTRSTACEQLRRAYPQQPQPILCESGASHRGGKETQFIPLPLYAYEKPANLPLQGLDPEWPPTELVDTFVFDDVEGVMRFALGDAAVDQDFEQRIRQALAVGQPLPLVNPSELANRTMYAQLADGTAFIWIPQKYYRAEVFAGEQLQSRFASSRAHEAVAVYDLDKIVLRTNTVPATILLEESNMVSNVNQAINPLGAGVAVRFVPGFNPSVKDFIEDEEPWLRLIDTMSGRNSALHVALLDYMVGFNERLREQPFNEIVLQDGRIAAIDTVNYTPYTRIWDTLFPVLSSSEHVVSAIENAHVLPPRLRVSVDHILDKSQPTMKAICDFHRSYLEHADARALGHAAEPALTGSGYGEEELTELGTCLFLAKVEAIKQTGYRLGDQQKLSDLFATCQSELRNLDLCASQ